MRLAALSLLALSAIGCASTPALPRPGAARDAEMEEVKRRVLELQREAAVHEVELARLREKVATLEARLGGGSGALPAPAAERPAARPPAPPPASRPAAVVEAPLPPAALEEDDLDDAELAGAVAPAVAGAREPTVPPPSRLPSTPPADATAPVTSTVAVPREAQVIYDEAYTLYHQGRYEEAEERFATFLLANPATELSDNAQYWIGASRFARGDFRGALVAFRQTVERYPAENKLPDALYKIGQTLEELADVEQAREVYRELVRRFPDTAAATLATERLDALE
jgi:tol-pal system protein YbgF